MTRRGTHLVSVLATIGTLAVLGAGVFYVVVLDVPAEDVLDVPAEDVLAGPAAAAAETTPPVPTDPPGPTDNSPNRILPAVTATTTGTYAFSRLDAAGEPVRYSPCSVIRYTVNPDGAPADGLEVIRSAIGRVSETTGLSFEEVENTTDRVGANDASWIITEGPPPPVLIGFATEGEYPSLAGEVAGIGGSSSFELDGGEFLFSGEVALDEDFFADLAANGRTADAIAVVAHEFGHVVGLDHVEAPGELMEARGTGLTDFGPGDLAGLAVAGSGPCLPR